MAVPAWIYIVFWIAISCTMVNIIDLFSVFVASLHLSRKSIVFPQILFNKAVLDQLKFPFPMFLVCWHMVLATVLTRIMSSTTKMLPAVAEVSDRNAHYGNIEYFDIPLI